MSLFPLNLCHTLLAIWLKLILGKEYVKHQTTLNWHRAESIVGLLWKLQRTFEFHKRREISWLDEPIIGFPRMTPLSHPRPRIKANVGRAIAQAVSRRLTTAAARVQTRVWSCGILWFTKVALGQVFSENFGFPCQSTFHLLLHNHLHYHPRLPQ
jgi:hypothetical protein